MYYYFVIALQGFCVYHCYTNRNNYYWFFAIIFLLIIGSLLYLFMNVIQKNDIAKAQENIVAAINPTKKIKDLEKRLKFSDSFENRVALADTYLDENMYQEAIENYKASLKDVFENDFYVLTKLQEAYYQASEYDNAIATAELILDNQKFKKSDASFIYSMSLEKVGDIAKAELFLRNFDAPYNYYKQRLELARFLHRNKKVAEARIVYQEIVDESENMSKQSFKNNKFFIRQAKTELNQFT